jgi:hypothetical protein
VVITTYDYIIKDKSSLGKIKWNYIIIDEVRACHSKPSCPLSSYSSFLLLNRFPSAGPSHEESCVQAGHHVWSILQGQAPPSTYG